MKILFAVSNERISESIIKKYESMYREIVSSKNVYYFNAILKEVQKDKSYDRIIISEDLEPFTSKNYEVTDNFIFDKLDKISDEAVDNAGEDIPIILIAADRRQKGEAILSKLFGIGVYNILIGQDRTVQNLCELISKPRAKKDAKVYYRIDANESDYKAESEDHVSETEIQSILTHYKRLGKNEDKYVESFDRIASQYNDQQLKVIVKFLPLGVKAVLEARSPKYQQIATFAGEDPSLKTQKPYNSTQTNPVTNKPRSVGQAVVDNGIKIESIGENEPRRLAKPVVIPGTVSTDNVRKVQRKEKPVVEQEEYVNEPTTNPVVEPEVDMFDDIDNIDDEIANNVNVEPTNNVNNIENEDTSSIEDQMIQGLEELVFDEDDEVETVGNNTAQVNPTPNMQPAVENVADTENAPTRYTEVKQDELGGSNTLEDHQKRGRGRPRKILTPEEIEKLNRPKRGRGRPRKVQPGMEDSLASIDAPIAPTTVEEPIAPDVRRVQAVQGLNGIQRTENDAVVNNVNNTVNDLEDEFDEFDDFDDVDNINTTTNNTVSNIPTPNPVLEDEDDSILPGFDDEDEDINGAISTQSVEEDDYLPGFDEGLDDENTLEFDDPELPGFEEIDEVDQQSHANSQVQSQDDEIVSALNSEDDEDDIFNEIENDVDSSFDENYEDDDFTSSEDDNVENNQIQDYNNPAPSGDMNRLLTGDKKVVAFVGTSKNGTSFLINNIADIFSKQGIKTAILDLTKNKNSYYIYTKNEENLRKTATECMNKLVLGTAQGVYAGKDLDVYTSLPGEDEEVMNQCEQILSTLVQNYSLVLLDCDFNTNYEYLRRAQEIYLVQSMDVLTIQPLTAYLRDLKAKTVLDQDKIRIVINKYTKVRSVTEKTIIGGMAFYNDPSMSFMTELFNRESVKYTIIPFEMQTYSKYLEGLVNCNITTNEYSKEFISALRRLASMVYPLLSNNAAVKNKYENPKYNKYASNNNTTFSNNINDTLDKMKNNY